MSWRDERNKARSTDDLNLFLSHPNFLVRDGLLSNINVNPEILEQLSLDDSFQIREKLAKYCIMRAAHDDNWRVRYACLKDNVNIPDDVLNILMNDKDSRVRDKAIRLGKIRQDYDYRQDFDNGVTIKLVIPGSCNANCRFCYNKHSNKMEICSSKLKDKWLNRFLISLEEIVLKIDGKQPISIDITGNEPTLDSEFFIKVMHKLRGFSLMDKINRITCTTNGINLCKVAPYMRGIVNYVNISVHDYDQDRRNTIFGTYYPTSEFYKKCVKGLIDNNINASAVAVISDKIDDFYSWRENFIEWAQEVGFVSLRFRHNVYFDDNEFLKYMFDTINDSNYYVIQREDTPDSNWCQLSTKDGFQLFFLKGVVDTYQVSPGIEFIVHDNGLAYANFDKTVPFSEYDFPVGYVFDKKVRRL